MSDNPRGELKPLCISPARAASKGFPRKNILPLAGASYTDYGVLMRTRR